MRDKISFHQMMAILWVALLAPVAELLPGTTVEQAGRLAWLTPLVAIPPLVCMGYLLYKVGGLQKGLREGFGSDGGNCLTLLYIVWGGLLLVLRLRLVGERLMGVGERDGALWFLVPALAVLTGWMAWGKRGAFARTVEVFLGVIATTIIIVVLLSAAEMEGENLLPIWWTDGWRVGAALPATLGTLGYGIFAAAFLEETQMEKRDEGRWLWWSVGGCMVLAAIQLVILGNFGVELTTRLEQPFFALSKSIGVEGMFQRVESVVAALWTLCDLAMLGLLLRSTSYLCKGVVPRWKESYIAPSILFPVTCAAIWLIPDGFTAQTLSEGVAIWGNLVLGWIIPTITIIIVYLKRRGK